MPGPEDETPPPGPAGAGGTPAGTQPVRRMPPRWRWAPGTVAVSALCGLIWVYTGPLGHVGLVDAGATVPIPVWQGQWWRLVTSLFLHGSFFHVAFNVALWWNLAALVELRYGTARLLAVMLLTGVAGNLGQMLAPGLGMTGAIGLSGAVYGVFFFGFLTLRPLGGPFGMLFSKTFAAVLIGWGLFAAVLTRLHVLPVANWAHGVGALSGLALGAVVAWRGWRRWAVAAGGLVLGAGLCLAAWRPVWSPGWQYYEAVQQLVSHRPEAAIARFVPLVKRYPKVVGIRWRYAMALAEAGHGVEARKVYEGLTAAERAQVPAPIRRVFEGPPAAAADGGAATGTAAADGGAAAGTAPADGGTATGTAADGGP